MIAEVPVIYIQLEILIPSRSIFSLEIWYDWETDADQIDDKKPKLPLHSDNKFQMVLFQKLQVNILNLNLDKYVKWQNCIYISDMYY
ncbi:unnamed protein product [Paramecium pentaurelia]|uniref:Uncharacterized protein n=1 Tax=Paramecium pentaurelia TaxID=43138 RepID=A0A8S1VRL5_9CILI|nr:unnamed protein product [Paramecium pentaurelia]